MAIVKRDPNYGAYYVEDRDNPLTGPGVAYAPERITWLYATVAGAINEAVAAGYDVTDVTW